MRKSRIGEALPMGATVVGTKEVQFVTRITGKKEVGLVLYNKKTGEREVVPFLEEYRIGNMYSMIIENLDPKQYYYNFVEDTTEVTDPYGKWIIGNENWGVVCEKMLCSAIGSTKFDWGQDKNPMTPYQDSIFYQLHVRGFTKHTSSGVKKKGTFEGICEKIPYLKELGVTAIELLPAYEFIECEHQETEPLSLEYIKENYMKNPREKEKNLKVNYWGFKEAFYFAPKASYSGSKNPSLSFKTMVHNLHEAGLEVIMQLYFPPSISRSYISEVMEYWVKEYHVDGFHLLGVGIPISFLASQPVFWNTKLLYEGINGQEVYGSSFDPAYKNLAVSNDGYMYALRKFLKSDVGSLNQAFQSIMLTLPQIGNMVYFTNYNTFTLKDLVSYDRKHNEENKEGGRDGNCENLSWNCGIEGPTRKKNVVSLRQQQMRNAMVLLLISKGTPVILAGDEFGNSQNGNNNPYCQDNLITWLNWKDISKNQTHYEFTRNMISLVKQWKLLKKEKRKVPKRSDGEYPYMSFHGTDAWKLDWSASNEEAGGILYCENNTYVYVAINMHWSETTLALPNIPGNPNWQLLVDTTKDFHFPTVWENKKAVPMAPRSIKIIMAQGSKGDINENLSAF